MKQSYAYSLIKNFLAKRSKEKNKIKDQNKSLYLFLNSNPWFSAVTDYSLQICLYLKKNNERILYGAEKGSTAMDKKCLEYNIPFFNVPIHNMNFFNFIISFIKITRLLSRERHRIKYVFVFEGREHTLLILTRVLFPFLWYNKKLFRVRGQSQPVHKKFFSIMSYKYYTDKIIFAADCVLKRVQFFIPEKKYLVQPYCKDINFKEEKLKIISHDFIFSERIPPLSFNDLTFLVLGRFDAVKGHDMVIQAFLNTNIVKNSSLVFIGKSENINAKEFFQKYSVICNIFIEDYNKYYLEINNKKIYIVDEKFNDIHLFMKKVSFGIISSLDSEVICRVGVEFLQNSVPCFYSDAGALPEVFSDFPEFNFKKGDIHSLALKMEQAENLKEDKDKFFDIKARAKKIGHEKYGLDNLKNIFLP